VLQVKLVITLRSMELQTQVLEAVGLETIQLAQDEEQLAL
jgi:hypothetical protein